MAAGASVIAASYLGWRINLESKGIALDSNSTRMTGFSLLCLIPLTGGASIAAPKPKTRASPTQSSDAPLAPSPDAADENGDDELPSEEDGEASSQAAFDPVTGKINWDCPCLGGMAYGPCGMQFREAFSCFVFSEEDPKGIDCVEKFKAMQDCFRENPDVYGDGMQLAFVLLSSVNVFKTEIMNDDEEDEAFGQSPTAGDTVPASPARPPEEPPSIEVSSKPA